MTTTQLFTQDGQYEKQLFMNNGGQARAGLIKLPEVFRGIPTAILGAESLKFVASESKKEHQKELEQRVRHEIHKLSPTASCSTSRSTRTWAWRRSGR
jgi:hypothetical protein